MNKLEHILYKLFHRQINPKEAKKEILDLFDSYQEEDLNITDSVINERKDLSGALGSLYKICKKLNIRTASDNKINKNSIYRENRRDERGYLPSKNI